MTSRRWVLIVGTATALWLGLAIAWLIHPVPALLPAPSPRPHATIAIVPPLARPVASSPSLPMAEAPVPRRLPLLPGRRVVGPAHIDDDAIHDMTVTTTNSW